MRYYVAFSLIAVVGRSFDIDTHRINDTMVAVCVRMSALSEPPSHARTLFSTSCLAKVHSDES